jgi:hypothetical protein
MFLETPFVFMRFLLEVQQPSWRVSTKQLGPDAIAFFVQLFGRAPEPPKNAVGHCQRDFSFPGENLGGACFVHELRLGEKIGARDNLNPWIDLARRADRFDSVCRTR